MFGGIRKKLLGIDTDRTKQYWEKAAKGDIEKLDSFYRKVIKGEYT